MYKQILTKIKEYDTIIIHRHIQPDVDALGSQIGLKGLIKDNFPEKTVYAVGDMTVFDFLGEMDEIPDAAFQGALSIVVDVAQTARVSDDRFRLAEETMVIDHHKNDTDFADVFISRPDYIATALIIAEMCQEHGLHVGEDVATALFAGIVTDSGRFLYPSTDALTFRMAAFLCDQGARIQEIYDSLYDEDLNLKRLKGYFINNFRTTTNHVAYMKNDSDLKEQYDVSTFTVSRGMVNQMAGIKGIPAWANFTEDDDGQIQCELRSKSASIVDIAMKYGGGGHDLACGCTVESWETTDRILADLDARFEREENNG